jgi:hypothetical protein
VSLTQGDSSVLDKGLAGGERVVIEGANQLRNGGKVDTGDGKARGKAAPALPPGLADKPGERPARSTAEGGAKVDDKPGERPARSTAEGGAKVDDKPGDTTTGRGHNGSGGTHPSEAARPPKIQ